MTLLTSSEIATSFTSAGPPSAPAWRLVRSGAKSQCWSLPTGRCTVGSSPQCQIHLTEEGVRPLHCLIVHSADETQITRWAADAFLNGEDFSTAPIKPGDRITIGGIALELVAEPTPETSTQQFPVKPKAPEQTAWAETPTDEQLTSAQRRNAPTVPLVTPRRVESQEPGNAAEKPKPIPAQWERDRIVRRLWAANYNSRSRCRQIIGSLRALRDESAKLDQQTKALRSQLHRAVEERERLAAELKLHQTQSDERDRQSTAELDRLISELSEAYERANAAEQSVAGQAQVCYELRNDICALTRERDQLQKAQAEDEQNRILLSEELADRDRTIDDLVRQLHDAQESSKRSTEQSQQLSAQLLDVQQRLARQQTEREQLAAEHTSQAERLVQVEQTLAERSNELQALESKLAAVQLEENSFQQRQAQNVARIKLLESEVSQLQGERDDLIVDQSKRMNYLQGLEQTLLSRDLAISDLEGRLQESAAAQQAADQVVADYAAQVDSLEAARTELASEQAKLIEQLQEMGETISTRDHAIAELRCKLEEAHHFASQTAEEQAAEYEGKIQALEAERDSLAADQLKLAAEAQQWGETIARRDGELEQLRDELDAARRSTSEVEQQRAEQKSRVESLESEREALQAERETLNNQVEQLGDTVAQRDRDLEHLRRQLGEAQEAARSAQEQTAKYVATIDGLHTELQQKEAQREQLTALQAEFAERRQRLEESLNERDHALEDLQRQLQEATGAAHEAREREAAQTAAVEALQGELEKERAEHEQAVDTHARAASRLHEVEDALADRERRHGELEKEYAKVCQALQTLEQGSFEQLDACRQLEEQLAEVRKERDNLASKHSNHAEEFDRLQSELEARDREVAELNEQLTVATARRAEAETEAGNRTEACRLLEREMGELRSRCERVTGELTVGRVQHLELQESIAQYEERIAALNADLQAAHQAKLDTEQAAADKLASQGGLATEVAELREQYDQLQQTLDAETELRKEANQEVAKRKERIELLEVDLRSANSECKQATEKLARLTQERAAAEEQLDSLRAELEASNKRLEELADGESHWSNERDALAAELEAARQELAELQAQVASASQNSGDVSEELAALESERVELAQRLTAQEELVALLTSEVDAARGQFTEGQTQYLQLEARYEQSQRELAAAQQCLLTAEKALQESAARKSVPVASKSEVSASAADDASDGAAEQAIEHLRELSVWSDDEPGNADSVETPAVPTTESKSIFQPSSFIDQYGHMFEAEEPAAPVESAFAPPSANPASELFAEPPHDESDDAALEAYMNNLMRRVRGDSPSAPSHGDAHGPAASQSTSHEEKIPSWLVPSVSKPAAKEEIKEVIQEEAKEDEVVVPLDMDSLRMTSNKPPLATDIKALRELANTSARRAIAKHSKRRHRERAVSKLLVCGVASAVAAYMMLTAESVQSPLFLAGLVPAVVGLRWGLKFLGVLLDVIREGTWNKAHAAELSLEEGPLPIDGRAEQEK